MAQKPAIDERWVNLASKRRRPESVSCGWCGTSVVVLPTGRLPSWCSSSCRHRAWETRRANASGRPAVEIVERLVEVEVPVVVTETIEVASLPKGAGWGATLHYLAAQIDAGRVYDRDLAAVGAGLEEVLTALGRRPRWRRMRR